MSIFKTLVLFMTCVYSSITYAEFKIISRTEWGAKEAQSVRLKKVNELDYNIVTLHFVTGSEYAPCGEKVIQDFQKKMMDLSQTADVPFQFLIDSCGNIYQGQELNTLPFHSGSTMEYKNQKNLSLNPNFKNIGIVLLGQSSSQVSIPQQAASVWLIEQLHNQYDIESLLNIESLKNQIQLCQYSYVASDFNRSVISQEQKDAFRKISLFHREIMQIDQSASFCSNTY